MARVKIRKIAITVLSIMLIIVGINTTIPASTKEAKPQIDSIPKTGLALQTEQENLTLKRTHKPSRTLERAKIEKESLKTPNITIMKLPDLTLIKTVNKELTNNKTSDHTKDKQKETLEKQNNTSGAKTKTETTVEIKKSEDDKNKNLIKTEKNNSTPKIKQKTESSKTKDEGKESTIQEKKEITKPVKESKPEKVVKGSPESRCEVPSGDKSLNPWVARVRTKVIDKFGITNIGGTRPGDPQDHGKGLALDVMVPLKSREGDEVADWFIKHNKELNVKYVIWNKKIWAPYKPYWREMEDRGNVSANHYDHVHISFNGNSGSCPE